MSSNEASMSSKVLAAAGHDMCEIYVLPFFYLKRNQGASSRVGFVSWCFFFPPSLCVISSV